MLAWAACNKINMLPTAAWTRAFRRTRRTGTIADTSLTPSSKNKDGQKQPAHYLDYSWLLRGPGLKLLHVSPAAPQNSTLDTETQKSKRHRSAISDAAIILMNCNHWRAAALKRFSSIFKHSRGKWTQLSSWKKGCLCTKIPGRAPRSRKEPLAWQDNKLLITFINT